MRRRLYLLAMILFIFATLITTVFVASFNPRYYTKMYDELAVSETIGVSDEELKDVTITLFRYIKGKQPSLDHEVTINGQRVEMFNDREKAHMVDVKNLYLKARFIRDISMIFVAVMLVISLGTGDYLDYNLNKKIVKESLLIVSVVIITVGVMAVLDFTTFWITFHKLVFTNDLWLLDPATDRMISMVPEPVFMGLVYRILVMVLAEFAVLTLAYFGLDWMDKKNDSRRTISA